MKTIVKLLVLGGGLLLGAALPAFSDEVDPPPPPSGHGAGGDQGPAGAPIDGGLGILVAMGAAYGCKKYLQTRNKIQKVKDTGPGL